MQTSLTAERIRESVDRGLWRNESLETYLDRWARRRTFEKLRLAA